MTPLAAQQGKICVFACRWCSLLGAERAGRERLPLPARIRVVPVTCAGSVSADMVIAALAGGAAGVAVLGCHLGGCRHNDANRDAHVRLQTLAELLDAVGIDQRRLLISWGTAHEAEQYARLMQEFATRLTSLDRVPSPSKPRNGAVSQKPLQPAPALSPARHPAPAPEENQALRALVAQVLASPGQTVFGLQKTTAGIIPALFTAASDLETLVAGPKYPLAKSFARILRDNLPEAAPESPAKSSDGGANKNRDIADSTLREAVREALPPDVLPDMPHVACRACDARALRELACMQQFPEQALSFIRIPCSPEQISACGCTRPDWPDAEQNSPNVQGGVQTPVNGQNAANSPLVPLLFSNSLVHAEHWQTHFMNCTQCHWCRAACPVCVCPSCTLDGESALPAGLPPPSPLGYHLTHAMHIADKCVECGACQDACPQGLPLLALHRAAAHSLRKTYGYESARKIPSPFLRARAEAADVPQWLTTPKIPGMEKTDKEIPDPDKSGGRRA